MTMTAITTVDTPELAKRVPRSEMTRAVAEAYPALIEALEKAGEAYYQHDEDWQDEVARQQRAGGMLERDLESPYGKALREAATAVTDAFDVLVASGQIEAKS